MKITAKTSATGSENLSAPVKNNWLTKFLTFRLGSRWSGVGKHLASGSGVRALICMVSSFCGVNTPTMSDFKLPRGSQ